MSAHPLVAALAVLGLGSLGLTGCSGSCRDACEHMLDDCGVQRAQYGVEDCVLQCEQFLAHYDKEWQEQQSKDAVRCVRNASCEDLRSPGAESPCYDRDVFIW